MSPHKRFILLEALGLCEHCGILLTAHDMSADSIDADWACPKCGKLLTEKTFGYETKDGKPSRVRWVGPNGNWINVRPSNEFILGNWRIVQEFPGVRYY